MSDYDWNIEAMLEYSMQQKIKQLRARLGLSLAEMAKCAGLNVTFLRNLESGKEKMTPELLAQILDACYYFGEENSAIEKSFDKQN